MNFKKLILDEAKRPRFVFRFMTGTYGIILFLAASLIARMARHMEIGSMEHLANIEIVQMALLFSFFFIMISLDSRNRDHIEDLERRMGDENNVL